MTIQAMDFSRRERDRRLPKGLEPHGMRIARRLRGIVLLGGVPRRTALAATVRRSVLDLPVAQGRTLIQHWLREIQVVGDVVGAKRLPVRLVLDQYSTPPITCRPHDGVDFQVERDPMPFRGVGGLLHDLGRSYEADDVLLVVTAGQIPLAPLASIVVPLMNQHEDLSLSAEYDGTVGGAFLISCSCLRDVPAVGFVDFKEQALPKIAAENEVTVVRCDGAAWHPVRDVREYVHALRLRHLHTNKRTPGTETPPDWQPVFSIIEDGAQVDPTAQIFDSVILRGARVNGGAQVIRSVIPSGVSVRAAERFADWTVTHDRIAV